MGKKRARKHRLHHIGSKASSARKANALRNKGHRVRVLLIDRKPKTYAVFADGVRKNKRVVRHHHKRRGLF